MFKDSALKKWDYFEQCLKTQLLKSGIILNMFKDSALKKWDYFEICLKTQLLKSGIILNNV